MFVVGLASAMLAAFAVPSNMGARATHQIHPRSLQMVGGDSSSSYDLTADTYDFLEGKSFRKETTIKYGVTNRVEQLRLIFFASSAVVGLIFPWLTQELFFDEPLDTTGQLTAVAASVAFALAAFGEKQSRGRKLVRIERELQLGELSIWQPQAALGGGGARCTVASLRDRRRVVALVGPPALLLEALEGAAVYRRRLAQSGVALVAIAVQGTSSDDTSAADWTAASGAAEAEGW